MMTTTFHKRYAIYFCLPESSEFQTKAAHWLGWDVDNGQEVASKVPAHWTHAAKKYGFHATMKAPFRLSNDSNVEALKSDVARCAAQHRAFSLGWLDIRSLGGFLAFMPQDQPESLSALAADLVKELDCHRDPLSEEEMSRRRAAKLTESQDLLLQKYGYPYVLEEFKFHMTLTGNIEQINEAAELAKEYFANELKDEIFVREVALCGERLDGQFEVIERFSLS